MARASASLLFRSSFVFALFAIVGGVRISERWYLDHMGVMAFWRTVIGMANLSLMVLVVLRVFEFL